MLNHEWRELEELCDRLHTLRHRYIRAQRSKNMGLAVGLKAEIALAKRQRESLVHYISARLSTITSDPVALREVLPLLPSAGDADEAVMEASGETIPVTAQGEVIIGFLDG